MRNVVHELMGCDTKELPLICERDGGRCELDLKKDDSVPLPKCNVSIDNYPIVDIEKRARSRVLQILDILSDTLLG
jgi:hypothetical protein